MSTTELPEMPAYIASVHSPTLNRAVEAYAIQAVEADRKSRTAVSDVERELAAALNKTLNALAEVLPYCEHTITPRLAGVALQARITAVQALVLFDVKVK